MYIQYISNINQKLWIIKVVCPTFKNDITKYNDDIKRMMKWQLAIASDDEIFYWIINVLSTELEIVSTTFAITHQVINNEHNHWLYEPRINTFLINYLDNRH